jgi:hypothetical protein
MHSEGCDGFAEEHDRPQLITSGYNWLIPFVGISLYRDCEHEEIMKRPKTSKRCMCINCRDPP